MKAITILQPWASLIACGAKQIETRSWKTSYRGPIAIHAGKRCQAYHMNIAFNEPFYSALKEQRGYMLDQGPEGSNKRISYPLPGSVIAIADLVDCIEMTTDYIWAWRDIYGKNEIVFGDFKPGRYAWILANISQIDPVPAKGKQRLWEWEAR